MGPRTLVRCGRSLRGSEFLIASAGPDSRLAGMKIGVSSYSFSRLVRSGQMAQLAVIAQAKEMGFDAIQTYILDAEPGTSLRAAGWSEDGTTSGGDWNHSSAYAGKRRTDQPMTPKRRYVKTFRATPLVETKA